MSTPKRYKIQGPENVIESHRGEWVRWEDYCEMVRRFTEGEPVPIPPGYRALSDVIAETEKDPERKARLDKARRALRT